MSNKTPNQGSGYIAVRNGNGVKRCIFLNWYDARHLLEFDEAEYHVFDTLKEAETYLFVGPPQQLQPGIADATLQVLASTAVARSVPQMPKALTKKRARPVPTVTTDDDDDVMMEQKPPKQQRKIYKRWYDSFAHLKAYIETHHGSYEVDNKDTENAKLRAWIAEQQAEYRKMLEGREESTMNPEKVKLLRDVGFRFTFVKWDERIMQLQAYKVEHGDLNIPSNHAVLGKWFKSIQRQATEFQKTGKASRDLNAARLMQLRAIGFDQKKTKNVQLENFKDMKWEACFAKLKEYKQIHGNLQVPRTDEHLELFNFIFLQRIEYKKLKEGNSTKLSATRIYRLQEAGFEFVVRGNYQNWNERIEQMRQFKAENGHLNIPVKHAELGEFVARQRGDYRKRIDGLKSPMTDERLKILTDLGFNFEVGPRQDMTKKQPAKSWDERFQELLEYREEYGHTVVPQHTPGLGAWVKKQRSENRHMRRGEKTSMSADKALKLSSIGFVFDVAEYAKERKREKGDFYQMSVPE